jgi:hypothetical protein
MECSCSGTDIDLTVVLLTTQQDDIGYKSFKLTEWRPIPKLSKMRNWGFINK